MTGCESMFAHLNDVVDGELAAEHREMVEEHFGQCSECRAELEELKNLKSMALGLPAEIKTDRDLWPEINARVGDYKPEVRQWRSQLLAVAAVLVAAIGLTWVTVWNQPAVEKTAQVARTGDGVVQAAYEPASIDSFRAEYHEARAELERMIAEKRSTLAPETLEVIDSNLELIDQAISEIEKALAANPDADSLDRQLRMVYRQQIEVLRWAAHLAA